jgi:hypothetical protein
MPRPNDPIIRHSSYLATFSSGEFVVLLVLFGFSLGTETQMQLTGTEGMTELLAAPEAKIIRGEICGNSFSGKAE